MPLVSVITPLYRAEAFVPELVQSIRAQSFRDFEWICVDDCSPDRTAAALQRAAGGDLDVKIVRLPVNSGPAAARNAALRAAAGRYVAFLDADDVWLPEKLRCQVEFMQRTGYRFTFHDYRRMSVDGASVGSRVSGPDVVDWSLLHKRRGIGCLTVMLERASAPADLFPERGDLGEHVIHEDFVAWAKVLADGRKAYRLPMDLARYRVGPASHSASKARGARSVWHIYRVQHRIPLLRCAWYFVNYALSAFLLRAATRPRPGSRERGGASAEARP